MECNTKVEIDIEELCHSLNDNDYNDLIIRLFYDADDDAHNYIMKYQWECMAEADKEEFIQFIKDKSKDNVRLNKFFDSGDYTKSLWHDSSDKPKKDEQMVIWIDKTHLTTVWHIDIDEWNERIKNYPHFYWCYLSDILPKEENMK